MHLFSLYLIFFLSGISSLIYQVTWQRLLTVHYGVGSVSITLIVSIYMFGLGLGSLLGGRFTEILKDSIKQYFWVELCIGIFGLLSFPLIMTIGNLTAGKSYFESGFYIFIVLLIPTMLMGMSLPILVNVFSRFISDLTRSVSLLYFVNTLGAAIGAILASYVLISFYGIDIAIYIAATINILLGLSILLIKKSPSAVTFHHHSSSIEPTSARNSVFKYGPYLVFITGFMAIGYELIWFRVIGVLVKASPYAFASVLFIYLLGIALGSLIIGAFIKNLTINKRISLFYLLQILLALSVAVIFIGYYYLTTKTSFGKLTEISFNQTLHPPMFLLQFKMHFKTMEQVLHYTFRLGTTIFWPLLFVFIPTLFIGATFPVIGGLFSKKDVGAGRQIGTIYFFNIIGNVLGAIITGFVLLPLLGTEQTILLFILIGLLFAAPLLVEKKSIIAYVCLIIVTGLIFQFFPKKSTLYEAIHPKLKGYEHYFSEGIDGVVMTYVASDGTVENYINGDSHGGRPGYSFYAQVIEAASVVKDPANVLIIGYGTGSITEGALKIPGVKKVTVVELNQVLLSNLRKIPLFVDLLNDPRLEIVVEDGRRFLQKQNTTYDLVFMNPLRATTAYSNNIYSQQFFELVAAHLSPNAIFVVWSDAIDATFRTLDQVFDYNRLYMKNGEGFFLLSQKPFKLNDTNMLLPIIASYSDADQNQLIETWKGYKLVTRKTIRKLAAHVLPIQDWRPRTEYYIGQWY